MKNNMQKQGLSTTHKILIAGIAVILCAIVAVGIYIVNSRKEEPAATPDFGVGVITESNAAEIDKALNENSGGFNIKMTTDWVFPKANAVSSNSYVANTDYNKKPFYFDIVLEDTDEIVYTSPIIPVGSEIRDIKLTKTNLPVGIHVAICQYNLLNEENVPDDYANMEITLNILE